MQSTTPSNRAKSAKKLRCIQRSTDRHWVGDGFPVRTLFSYPILGPVLSPFFCFSITLARGSSRPPMSVSGSVSTRIAGSRQ